MVVRILQNDKGNPPGKLADAELHFSGGPLDGLKLMGFAIWERRTGGGRNVTFPSRQYSVNGERRSFALLRPIADGTAQDRLRELDARGLQGTRSAAAAVQGAVLSTGRRLRVLRADAWAEASTPRGALLSNSERKKAAFMPPSMICHGRKASALRSR